jgi:phospholipase C
MGFKWYIRPYPMKTIYNSLTEAGLDWRIYFHDVPQSLALNQLRSTFQDHYRKFGRFAEDVKQGNLPAYTFIEPRYFNFLRRKSNDQHPPHDVRLGEHLIAAVYQALRGSDLWSGSLLVILHDEHGGYFDHVPPPEAVNPDGKVSKDPRFNFRRLGPRVPAVLVSPYIERGTVDSTPYEHASLAATVKELWKLPDFLTKRDRAANPLSTNGWLAKPRTNAPTKLPRPPLPGAAAARARTKPLSAREVKAAVEAGEVSTEPLSELQKSLVALADNLEPRPEKRALALARRIETEHDAAVQVRDQVSSFFRRAGVEEAL